MASHGRIGIILDFGELFTVVREHLMILIVK